MYLFEAHYVKLDNNKEIIRKIEFNGQFLDNERECYLCAMGMAYDKIQHGEMFASLEFIGC